jgi:membrane associated rhomboid family serine protease
MKFGDCSLPLFYMLVRNCLYTLPNIHSGIVHLLMNGTAQLGFGLQFEKKWGTPKTAAIYVSSGIGGSILALTVSPRAAGVGASGALVTMQFPTTYTLYLLSAPQFSILTTTVRVGRSPRGLPLH